MSLLLLSALVPYLVQTHEGPGHAASVSMNSYVPPMSGFRSLGSSVSSNPTADHMPSSRGQHKTKSVASLDGLCLTILCQGIFYFNLTGPPCIYYGFWFCDFRGSLCLFMCFSSFFLESFPSTCLIYLFVLS